MSTDLYNYFARGSDYPEARVTGMPRRGCCGTCAFRAAPPTVRPDDVTLAALEEFTADMDDFLCHTPDEQGRYSTCAAWAALRW